MVLEPREVRDDEGRDEPLAVADDDGRRDAGNGLEEVLDGLGSDVLPARGDDEVLLAVRDDQEPVLVEAADVPRPEPGAVEDLPRLGLLLVIAFHDVRAAGQDLAVGRDPDLDAGDGLPHRPEADRFERIGREDGGGLRQAVAFEDDEPQGVEELGDVLGQRARRRRRRSAPGRPSWR